MHLGAGPDRIEATVSTSLAGVPIQAKARPPTLTRWSTKWTN